MNVKARWRLADRISKVLGCSRGVAFNGISTLKEHGLLKDVMADDKSAIERAQYVSWYGHTAEKAPKLPDSPDNTVVISPVEEAAVKWATWYIVKVGNVELAERAVKAAAQAIRSLRDEL